MPIKNIWSLNQVDISFFIADIKYDGNKLKILEFGQGPRSRFKGSDALCGKGTIWGKFWKYLEQWNLPIWYVGPSINQESTKDEINFKIFKSIQNTYAVETLSKLLSDYEFQKTIQKESPKNKSIIYEYQGIVVFRHKNASSLEIEIFKKTFPYMIVIDHASSPYVNNKYTTNLLFNEDELKIFRPRCNVYEKNYTTTLAQKIIADMNCDIYVIKPINGFKGDGVIMARKKNLDIILYNILNKTNAIQKSKNPTYNHWAKDKNKNFIVEEYEPSKIVKIDGLSYDPTLRMAFCLEYNNHEIKITHLDGYWKLPPKGLEEQGTLVEKTKSKINPNRTTTSAMIEDNDRDQVQKILNTIMPRVYKKMLKTRSISLQESLL